MAIQGVSQIQAAYLLNVGTLMIVRTNKCPKDFDYVPSLDECYYKSENSTTFDEATRICKEKGTMGIWQHMDQRNEKFLVVFSISAIS